MKKLSSILLAGALLPVCLLAAGKSEASQADDYVPQVRNLRLLAGNYCIARDLVKNASSLPADTVYEFVPEPDFKKAGRYQTRVRLLYPDNSVETSRKVTVTVCQHAFELKRGKKSKAKKHRKSDAKRYEAKVKNRTTAFGKAFKSKRLVTNRSSLPKKTSFRFARVPNFKRAGSYYTSIQVTYPDKSRKYTRLVKITVKRQPDKKKYQPKVQGRTVSYGAKLTAKSLVKNAASLPKKTAYAFAQKVSSRRAGTYYVAVRVTYPDKSWELTPLVKLVVKKQPDKDRYQALVSSAKVTLGRKLTAKSLVKNAASLPKKTVYRFKPQPNWQKAGSYRC
ncbi:Rib/alpha-like domain-containing protein, partial [Lactobacillus nasalidis]